MFNMEKYLEKLDETPLASWKKIDLVVPEILSEVYTKIFKLLCNVIDEGDINGFLSSRYEGIKDKEKYINQNFIAAGGFISDYLISKIHSSSFAPKDIDFFVGGRFLESILEPLTFAKKVEISQEEGQKRISEKGTTSGVVTEKGKYFEIEEKSNPWECLGKRLKKIFPDCSWKDNSLTGYEFEEINVVYHFNYKGQKIELIVGRDNRVLDFDISFRSAYYNNEGLYVNSMGLEDIIKKRMRILHSNSPISTCVRMMDFKERYGFEIEPLSLILLLNSINNKRLEINFFLDNFKEHKKYSKRIEEMFFNLPHKTIKDKKYTYLDRENEYVEYLYIDVEKLEGYNPELKAVYDKSAYLLSEKATIFYPKVEAFIRNHKPLEIIYERPEHWYTEDIFIKAFNFKTDFVSWYNQKRLTMTFDYVGKSNYTQENCQLSANDVDKIYEIIQLNKDAEVSELSSQAKEFIPFVVWNNKMKMEFDIEYLKSFILDGQLTLKFSDYVLYQTQTVVIDIEKKELGLLPLSNQTYFGFVGDLYLDYAHQIKNALGLNDYTIKPMYRYNKETNTLKLTKIKLKDLLENAEELKLEEILKITV